MIIDDIVSWCVDRCVNDGVCKVVEGEVNISKVMSVWRLMPVWVDVFYDVLVLGLTCVGY